MAPTTLIDTLVHMDTRDLQTREIPPRSLIAAIVTLAVVSSFLCICLMFVLVRFWRRVIAPRFGFCSPTAATNKEVDAMTQRKPSDWARQNSNVLWSMYIEEDDLKAQFSAPSRLFSIGSFSTDHGRCPLDRRVSAISEVASDKERAIDEKKTPVVVVTEVDVGGDLRSRAPYEQETTPTKAPASRARARSQPFRHRHSKSLEEWTKRKQSLAVDS
jgi:hypothetical protein